MYKLKPSILLKIPHENFYIRIVFIVFTNLLISTPDISGQDKISPDSIRYVITAEPGINNGMLSVNATLSGALQDYISNNILYVHLPSNAFRNRNSDAHFQILKGRNAEYYFDKSLEQSGLNDLTISSGETILKYQFAAGREDLITIILPVENLNNPVKEITFRYNYIQPGNSGKEYHYYSEWYPYPVVIDDYNKLATNQSTLNDSPDTKRSFSVRIKKTEGTSIITNTSPISPDKSPDGFESYFTNQNDFVWLTVPESAEIVKSNLIVQENRTELIIANFDDINTKQFFDKKQIESIFQFYTEQVGPYPFDKLLIITDKRHFGTKIFPGTAIIKIPEHTQHSSLFLTEVIGQVWLQNLIHFDKIHQHWYPEGIISYLREKYRMKNLKTELIKSVQRHNFQLYDPVAVRKLNYENIYYRSNQSFGTKTDSLSHFNICCGQQESFGQLLNYFEAFTGDQYFGDKMKNFFQYSKDKITSPDELIQFLSGHQEKELMAIYERFMTSDVRIDYQIKNVEISDKTINVKVFNPTNESLPFPLYIFINDSTEFIKWYGGFTGKQNLKIENVPDIKIINAVSADPFGLLPDYNRNNNHYFPGKMLPSSPPLKLRFITSENNTFTTDVLWSPLLLYNDNDKLMPGLVLANATESVSLFKYALIPAYSFSTKKWVGQAWVSQDQMIQSEKIKKIQYNISFKTFDFNRNDRLNYSQRFIKTEPAIELHFKNSKNCCNKSLLRYRFIWLQEQYPEFEFSNFKALNNEHSIIQKLEYENSNDEFLSNQAFNVSLEYQQYSGFRSDAEKYLKLTASFNKKWMIDNEKFLNIRFFGSGFILNTARTINSFANPFSRGTIALIHQGFNDYLYDEFFASRQNQNGKFANQVSLLSGGGFKTPVGSAYSIGMSNNFALAVNLSTDLPMKLPWFLPVKPYFDAGIYSVNESDGFKTKHIWNSGLMLNFEEIFSINIPLIYSKELGNTVRSAHPGFLGRVNFSLHLDLASPWRSVENKY